MGADEGWNSLVPEKNRIVTENFNARVPASLVPTHIVVHVTGTENFKSVKNLFVAPNSVSAHYLVHSNGAKFQFVPDARRAYHAGIDKATRALYRKVDRQWQKYIKYFSWYKKYPSDAVYLDGDLNPVWDKTEAVFVSQADNMPWSYYKYFNDRWDSDLPVNFNVSPDPNNYSIGIETLGVGSPNPDPTVYTNEMYLSLRELVSSLCMRYGIPNKKGRVVGHEDVNPIGRFGWDPSRGFDWSRVHD